MTRQEYYEEIEHDNRMLSVELHTLKEKIKQMDSIFQHIIDTGNQGIDELVTPDTAPDELLIVLFYFTGYARSIQHARSEYNKLFERKEGT